MSTGIEYLDETINPLGFGCYGVGGTPDKPNICYGGQCWAAVDIVTSEVYNGR